MHVGDHDFFAGMDPPPLPIGRHLLFFFKSKLVALPCPRVCHRGTFFGEHRNEDGRLWERRASKKKEDNAPKADISRAGLWWTGRAARLLFFCLSQRCTNQVSTRKKKESRSACQTRSVEAIPRSLRPRGLVHGTAHNQYAHGAIARSGGKKREDQAHRPRRGGPKHRRAGPTAASSLFFSPVQCASLRLSPRTQKETSKRRLCLSGVRHARIPAADKTCSHPHRMPPKRRRRGCRFPPYAQIVDPVALFFSLKPSRPERSRCRCAGATQRRWPPWWTRRRSACGACGFPRTNTRPVLSASLGPTSRSPRKRATRRRRESRGPRSPQPRHRLCNKRHQIKGGLSQVRPCPFVYSRR